LPAITQADFMQAIVGDDPDAFQVGTGVFPPVLPSATEVGLEPLTDPRSLDRSKALTKAAGYNGEPIRLLAGTDIHTIAAISAVAAATRNGICADVQRVVMDQVPYIPPGFYRQNMAMQRRLEGQLSGFPIFWNIKRL
jgi:peptide/nickel transport system substrate-binding protein